MSSKRMYNREGKFIGERVNEGTKIILYSAYGRYLGEYIKNANKTYDENGALVGDEDLLNTLIVD